MKPVQDEKSDALSRERFRMLEDIAKELSGDVSFPTSFDLAMHLRDVLRKPDVSLEEVARVIGVEPLVSTKLLRLANSVARNPGGKVIVTVEKAIARVGLEAARSMAFATVIEQLRGSRNLVVFHDLSARLWTHTLRTAAAARTVARRMTKLNREEAMTAGLVHDLGAFYMLYRASHYEEFCASPGAVEDLILEWHESIGESLLHALGLPEEMIEAERDHDQPRDKLVIPKSLGDVVFVSNLLAGDVFVEKRGEETSAPRCEIADERYQALSDEIESEYQELLGALH